MQIGVQAAAAVVVSSAIATMLFFGSIKSGNSRIKAHHLPECTANGQPILPKDFDERILNSSHVQ